MAEENTQSQPSGASLSLKEINAHVKAALIREFKVDPGFKYIDRETVLSYVAQVAVQRIKQRTKGKEDRAEMKRIKLELAKRGIKI